MWLLLWQYILFHGGKNEGLVETPNIKQGRVSHNKLESFGRQTAGLFTICKLYDLHVRNSVRGMHRRLERNKYFC